MAKAGEAVSVGLVHEVMGGEGRSHAAGRSGIGSDRFGAPADDVLADEIFDRFRGRTGRMRPVRIGIEKSSAGPIAPLPVRAQKNPATRLYVAVLFFPFADAVDREQIVGIGCRFLGAIDHAGWRDEIFYGNAVGRTVLVILSGDPMDGCVEVSAGVLSKLKPIPGPERPVRIIMRDFMDLYGGSVLANRRREINDRRLGPERRREIDNLDGPGNQCGGENCEDLAAHVVSPE